MAHRHWAKCRHIEGNYLQSSLEILGGCIALVSACQTFVSTIQILFFYSISLIPAIALKSENIRAKHNREIDCHCDTDTVQFHTAYLLPLYSMNEGGTQEPYEYHMFPIVKCNLLLEKRRKTMPGAGEAAKLCTHTRNIK